ncbi:ATP-binding protein [Chryseobacterium sp. KMC2]|uniref:tetratricopeptide repeat-containing sensor histidine kinase n=1 Tax=Chryseobacterium sp. KMC2 TaxID=2800705 RepID=UPI00192500C0|nr:ATP-binding protein [Chryseobacterium sp. KMC2]MBL3548635.1 ATP-binding protein [Chryseobacterium sp. KMC2]
MKKFLALSILINLISCSKKEIAVVQDNEENNYHIKARAFRDAKVSDSAFYYYMLAKDEYIKTNDSLRAGQSLVNMAIIETGKGDFYGSIETSLEANGFLRNTKDKIVRRDLASNYNNMGIASSFMYNYDDAIHFYKEAIKYGEGNNLLMYYNNIAVSLLAKRNAKDAKEYLKHSILATDNKIHSKALNNLAKANFLENKSYNPLPEYYKALEIRKNSNDIEGLNSSYSTLSDYFKGQNQQKALFFAQEMLETASKVNNPEDRMQALQKLINLDSKNFLIYFKSFKSLNDSLIIARGKAKNQFALIRYETEKNKAAFLKSQAENSQKENQILKQYVILITLSLALIGGLFWYRRRKKRLQQEKELEVKNTQLKMSKKVHDVVANGIYQVMTKIENQEVFDKEEALDELEFVYEKSRDISYDKTDIHEALEFDQKISALVGSFKNNEVETYLVGNDKSIWNGLKDSSRNEVYQIIRELLVNMKKHSRASRVVFKFERINNKIQIQYTDNGIGISEGLVRKNGLTNTDSRIETIHGEIIFDTKTEKGLKISISFPVS